MNITPQYVNKILKALPISYYCKRNVSVELTMEPNSYYSLSDDFIRVSYHNVYNIISKLKDETYLETSLRSLLYHEVAHAMLTPPSMITDAWMNIFEDERIERLTKDFFVGVDYEKNIKILCSYDEGYIPRNSSEAWFYLIRFHKGSKYWREKVEKLMNEFYVITRTLYSEELLRETYYLQVRKLWEEFNLDWNSKKNTRKMNSYKPVPVADISKYRVEHVGRVFTNFNRVNTNSIRTKMIDAINKLRDTYFKLGNTHKGYSGIIEPKLVSKNDYKWWNRDGKLPTVPGVVMMKKLNLFVDTSLSFEGTRETMNEIIRCLIYAEKELPGFEFDVVSTNKTTKIRPRNRRVITEGVMGNNVPDNYEEIIKYISPKNYKCCNIIIFNGLCYEADQTDEKTVGNRFLPFNNTHSVFIVDSTNSWIKDYCPKARVIVEEKDNYTKRLIDNIFIALRT